MNNKNKILQILNSKTKTKKEVFENSFIIFNQFKKALIELVSQYKKELSSNGVKIDLESKTKNSNEAQLIIGGDLLAFQVHTNVFRFDESHYLWKNSYVKKDELNGYVSIFNIYNFLSDSFRYNRVNDGGYLIARVFVNRENHFYLEGKKGLATLFNDFANDVIDYNKIKEIIENVILYSLDFDLLSPKFENSSRITVSQIQQLTTNTKYSTDKKLGFKFPEVVNESKPEKK